MAQAPTLSSSGSSLSLSSSDDLTDGELLAISHRITMSSFVVLGNVLGYKFYEVEEALTACKSNTEKASMMLLRRWRNEQPPYKDTTKDLLNRLNKAEERERNVRACFSGNVAREKIVNAVIQASCQGPVSSDNSAQSVSSACKTISRVNRRSIYLDIFPGSIACSLSMDSNRQREEDPGRSAVVETNSFSFRPCNEVHTLRTDSATTTVDAVNEASYEGTEFVSSDYSAQSVSFVCEQNPRVNRKSIYLDIFPGSIACSLSMDSNRQREEDPGRSAVVETNSFSFRPCNEVHTLRTDSATTAADAVNETTCEVTDLGSSDYSAQPVSSVCEQIPRVNRRTIYLDIFPGSGSTETSSIDSNGQREEDPGRSATVETNSFSFGPCKEVPTLKTDSATAAKNIDNRNNQELTDVATGKEVRESSSKSGIDFVVGSCKPLSDKEVFNVAEDIESDAQIENLGVALTFSRADINRYLGTNEILGSKTSRGSRMMLFDWRQTVRQRDQRSSFKGALVRAGLVMIADQYFPDVQEMAENRKCIILILPSLSVL
ncbi:uncharacterized protein LOC579263 [Strongylocentrotus purpuratus]|uniref:Death domain-containing protein n=1 Tax=Strongylocentrotus purpuratus TaxID=7668 RepID=A0A7M7N8Q6_STRPU|nr:uncharacterized protein LOC579263 [Strongylocentrotus purpuratus]